MAAPQSGSAAKSVASKEAVKPAPEIPPEVSKPSPTILYRVVGGGRLKSGGVFYNSGDEVELERSVAEKLIASGDVEEVV